MWEIDKGTYEEKDRMKDAPSLTVYLHEDNKEKCSGNGGTHWSNQFKWCVQLKMKQKVAQSKTLKCVEAENRRKGERRDERKNRLKCFSYCLWGNFRIKCL